MKRIILLATAFMLVMSLAYAQAPIEKKGKIIQPTPTENVVKGETKTPPTKLPKGFTSVKGYVVNLLSVVTNSKAPNLTRDQAKEMHDRGELLAFRAKNKVYIVVYADGRNTSKKLAEKAGSEFTLVGRVKTSGGITVLIVDEI